MRTAGVRTVFAVGLLAGTALATGLAQQAQDKPTEITVYKAPG